MNAGAALAAQGRSGSRRSSWATAPWGGRRPAPPGAGVEPVVIDLNIDTVGVLAAEGRLALYGDAGQPDILRDAGIVGASYLVVTLPASRNRGPMITAARQPNPTCGSSPGPATC